VTQSTKSASATSRPVHAGAWGVTADDISVCARVRNFALDVGQHGCPGWEGRTGLPARRFQAAGVADGITFGTAGDRLPTGGQRVNTHATGACMAMLHTCYTLHTNPPPCAQNAYAQLHHSTPRQGLVMRSVLWRFSGSVRGLGGVHRNTGRITRPGRGQHHSTP
jgi:hypothetical protein